ncbi:MAG: hypothetical protein J6O18_04420 [Bacilli bacterium]|nr:hypothetical protein [Bacilli bacterium]
MQKYERTIGLKTIYLTLVRRTEAILALFIVLVGASFIVTNFMMGKQYTSTSLMANNAAISQPTYTLMQNNIKSDATIDSVVKNLKTAKVTHGNGKDVTASEIKSGLSFSAFAANMVQFTVSFKSSDAAIVQYTLEEVMNVSYDVLKPTYAGLSIYSPASAAVKTSKENTYLLVGVAASLVVALGVPFVWEIAEDAVYDKKEVESWGAPAFELRASGK